MLSGVYCPTVTGSSGTGDGSGISVGCSAACGSGFSTLASPCSVSGCPAAASHRGGRWLAVVASEAPPQECKRTGRNLGAIRQCPGTASSGSLAGARATRARAANRKNQSRFLSRFVKRVSGDSHYSGTNTRNPNRRISPTSPGHVGGASRAGAPRHLARRD